jgi:hypothetical protein
MLDFSCSVASLGKENYTYVLCNQCCLTELRFLMCRTWECKLKCAYPFKVALWSSGLQIMYISTLLEIGGFATFFSNVFSSEQCLREIAMFISNFDVWKTFWRRKATFKKKTLFQCSQHCSHLCSNRELLSHNLC